MPQPLNPQITMASVSQFTVDPHAGLMVVHYTEGNAVDGVYAPVRSQDKTIEGAEMERLYSFPIFNAQGAQLNLREVIRSLVYGTIIPAPAPVIPAPEPAPEPDAPPEPEPDPDPEVPVEPPADPPVEPEPEPEVPA